MTASVYVLVVVAALCMGASGCGCPKGTAPAANKPVAADSWEDDGGQSLAPASGVVAEGADADDAELDGDSDAEMGDGDGDDSGETVAEESAATDDSGSVDDAGSDDAVDVGGDDGGGDDSGDEIEIEIEEESFVR